MALFARIRLLDVALRMEAEFLSKRAQRIKQWKKNRYRFLESEQTCEQFALAPPLTPDESKTLDALRLAFEHVFANLKSDKMCTLMGQLMRHKQSPTKHAAPDNVFWAACNRLAAYPEDALVVAPSNGGTPRTYCFTPLRHARQVEGMRLEKLRHPWWSFVQWYKLRPNAKLKQPELYGHLQQIQHNDEFAVRFVYDTRAARMPKVPHAVVLWPDGSYEQFWIYGTPGIPPTLATLKKEFMRLTDRVETLLIDPRDAPS